MLYDVNDDADNMSVSDAEDDGSEDTGSEDVGNEDDDTNLHTRKTALVKKEMGNTGRFPQDGNSKGRAISIEESSDSSLESDSPRPAKRTRFQ